MPLLERETHLRALAGALAEARAGQGRLVFVGGEAGLGKTTLVAAFVQQFALPAAGGARAVWGACEPLYTPRPLGPLYDFAARLPGPLPAALNSGAPRAQVFATALAVLGEAATVAVIEDAHWADDATLDLIQYLGRRLQRSQLLLIVTYRDDELGRHHPLRTVLGDLATSPAVRRLALAPLSLESVRVLASGSPLDAVTLHAQTGGNPFYVTEVVANPVGALPPTVRDAVLARAARLSPAAHSALEAAAIAGARVEPWLLAALTEAQAGAIDECLSAGLLVPGDDYYVFRHELTRQAVLASLSPLQRAAVHGRALAALRANPATQADLARLAHHAEGAGDRAAVMQYAPAAAQQARQASALRQAATLYRLALRHAGDAPPEQRAVLLEGLAAFTDAIDQRAEAVNARREAAALWRQVGNPLNEGANHALQVVSLLGMGRNAEAEAASQAALALFEGQPSIRHIALGYSTQATLRAWDGDYAGSLAWAERSLVLPGLTENFYGHMTARLNRGVAWMHLEGYDRGRAEIKAVLASYLKANAVLEAGNAYANLGSHALDVLRPREAERHLAEALAYVSDRDIEVLRLIVRAIQVRVFLLLGRWDEAAAAADDVLRRPGISAVSRLMALEGLGLLRARRGDPGVNEALDEALELAAQTGSVLRLGPVHAARAEAAWLGGNAARVLAEARAVYDLAAARRLGVITGRLAYWRQRAGDAVAPLDWVAPPYALHLAGDWRAAALAWEALGCPYEQACALAEGDVPAQSAALGLFERLGALPAAEQLRRQMQAAGTAIPRGPRPATRANPFGLTARQVEILRLLADDLSNPEIAARLHLSPKTVEHHVSAVLAKLEVTTRAAAARLARTHPDLAPPN
jgi:DNA-binding CsgD family transcriptional regulator